ncbi:hypothetical protein [Xenorhabdus bovienii]|uniref:hypothetical protein n=1 Tax=Xenorhabdus bovienii TaxID=40576 RepID=UPI003DA5EC33
MTIQSGWVGSQAVTETGERWVSKAGSVVQVPAPFSMSQLVNKSKGLTIHCGHTHYVPLSQNGDKKLEVWGACRVAARDLKETLFTPTVTFGQLSGELEFMGMKVATLALIQYGSSKGARVAVLNFENIRDIGEKIYITINGVTQKFYFLSLIGYIAMGNQATEDFCNVMKSGGIYKVGLRTE